MALAEKVLAARFNRPGLDIVDHYTYVLLGDGCLMEGISHEVASLAGTLKLGKLIAIYDDNGISIDGEVHGWFTDDTPKRFEAYGWEVLRDVDGHNPEAIKAAWLPPQSIRDKPTLICCKTIIGFGAPNKQGKEAATAPRSARTKSRRRACNSAGIIRRSKSPPPSTPAGMREQRRAARAEWKRYSRSIKVAIRNWRPIHAPHRRRSAGRLRSCSTSCRKLQADGPVVASRKASQMALDAFGPKLPELIGGSADLAGSNLTIWKGSKDVNSADAAANYVYYGVREFGMTAISNGLALHGGFIPYDATFLVFSDYARNAVRMSALIPGACDSRLHA